jgi:hypothetical protein
MAFQVNNAISIIFIGISNRVSILLSSEIIRGLYINIIKWLFIKIFTCHWDAHGLPKLLTYKKHCRRDRW